MIPQTDILLVEPPFFSLKDNDYMFFPLGLGYLASSLKGKGYNTRIYCCDTAFNKISRKSLLEDKISSSNLYKANIENKSLPVWTQFIDVVKQTKPKIVGLCGLTAFVESAWECAKLVKKNDPDIKVILGGPHITVDPDYLKGKNEIDYGIRGEGEIAMNKLVGRLFEQTDCLYDIPGVCYINQDGTLIDNGLGERYDNIDDIPLPARDSVILLNSIDLSKFFSRIMSSRGCPFKCSFCSSNNTFGRKMRYRDTEAVIEEMKLLHKEYGINDYNFMDDTLTVNAKRTIRFCKKTQDLDFKINWSCFSRADGLTEELAIEMYKSGCRTFYIGIESGSEKMLEYLNKGITLKEVYAVDKMLKWNRIPWNAFFIIGLPRETESDLEQTFSLMKRITPTHFAVKLFSPYPGTPLYEDAKSLDLIPDNLDWSHISTENTRYTFLHEIKRNKFLRIRKKILRWADVYNSGGTVPYYVKQILKDQDSILYRSCSSLYKMYRKHK